MRGADLSDNNVKALPEEWVWTTIGQVADTTSGGTPSRKHPEYYTDGIIPWIKSGELRDGLITQVEESITEEALRKSSAKIFPQGTPVVALYGATVGKTGILGIDAATNQAVCAIFALEKAFTAKFMTYWLQLQRSNLIEMSSGGAQPNISQGIVRAYHFPLAPLPEQHRIVDAIETQFTRLDAAVAALQRAKTNLARYKASVLKAACRGEAFAGVRECFAPTATDDYEPADVLLRRILAERRARWMADNPGKRYTEPAGPDTSNLPELPEGWCWSSLGQLIERIDAGKSPKAQPRPAQDGEFGVLKVSAVSWERFLSQENKALFPKDKPKKNLTIKSGDLLISRANTVELAGAVVLVERDYSNLMLSDKTLRLVTASEDILKKYLLYVLRAPIARKFFERNATGTSDSMRNISQAKFRSTPIALPPLAEQRRIVAEVERRLSVVAEVEAEVEANLARAERLRQSILKRAFEGRLV